MQEHPVLLATPRRFLNRFESPSPPRSRRVIEKRHAITRDSIIEGRSLVRIGPLLLPHEF